MVLVKFTFAGPDEPKFNPPSFRTQSCVTPALDVSSIPREEIRRSEREVVKDPEVVSNPRDYIHWSEAQGPGPFRLPVHHQHYGRSIDVRTWRSSFFMPIPQTHDYPVDLHVRCVLRERASSWDSDTPSRASIPQTAA